MKIKIIKPIKISSVGKTVLPIDFECEVSKSAGDIYIEKGFAKEVKDPSSDNHPANAVDAIALIKEVKEIEGLEPFAKDIRTTVKAAYEEKLKELKPE
jgi:hypothetical protein